MLVVGVLAVIAILAVRAFQPEMAAAKPADKNSPATEQNEQSPAIAAAPSDAVVPTPASDLPDAQPSVIRDNAPVDSVRRPISGFTAPVFSSFLRTLLRTIISPQAP